MGSGVMPDGDSSQLAGGGRSPGWLLMLPVERDFEKPFGVVGIPQAIIPVLREYLAVSGLSGSSG